VLAAREMLAADGGAGCSAGMRQSWSEENGNREEGTGLQGRTIRHDGYWRAEDWSYMPSDIRIRTSGPETLRYLPSSS
jgi:hypothetical protein